MRLEEHEIRKMKVPQYCFSGMVLVQFALRLKRNSRIKLCMLFLPSKYTEGRCPPQFFFHGSFSGQSFIYISLSNNLGTARSLIGRELCLDESM